MLLYVYFEIDVNSATYVGTLIFILNSDSYWSVHFDGDIE